MAAICIRTAVAQNSGCPTRQAAGSVVNNPLDLYSANGLLQADFTMHSQVASYLEECFIYQSSGGEVEAPTFRLNPGDQLMLSLTNRLSYLPGPPVDSAHLPVNHAGMAMPGKAAMPAMANMMPRTTANNPCTGGTMVATSTNIHFHGLNIPPVCHGDEIIYTTIENTDPAFQYSIQIPANDAPGMYWYHPHLHGFATLQVNGGATGIIIINGMEKVKPQVANLPERVFVVRQEFTNPNSWIAGPFQLTLNYVPAAYPNSSSPIVQMQPGVKEFWRVANTTSQAFLALQFLIGNAPQNMELIALDGIPVTTNTNVKTINLPPAGRAEFIVTAPASGQTAVFQDAGFNTGPIGNANNPQVLAAIQITPSAHEPPAMPATSPRPQSARALRGWQGSHLLPAGVSISRKPPTAPTDQHSSS